MKRRQQDIITPELQADAEDMLAFIDQIAADQIAEAKRMRPKRVFDQFWIGEDGRIMYDFEVFKTGISLREWEAHEKTKISH